EIDRRFGKSASQDDAEIIGLFRQWIKAERAAGELRYKIALGEWDQRLTPADDLLMRIAERPARGPAGLAIKVYLAAHERFSGPYDSPETLYDFDQLVVGNGYDFVLGSAINDAVQIVPELAPLTEQFLAMWRRDLRP